MSVVVVVGIGICFVSVGGGDVESADCLVMGLRHCVRIVVGMWWCEGLLTERVACEGVVEGWDVAAVTHSL